eukprot:scaffold50434_cov42-Phaeocystis_antarctica.AAC.1
MPPTLTRSSAAAAAAAAASSRGSAGLGLPRECFLPRGDSGAAGGGSEATVAPSSGMGHATGAAASASPSAVSGGAVPARTTCSRRQPETAHTVAVQARPGLLGATGVGDLPFLERGVR